MNKICIFSIALGCLMLAGCGARHNYVANTTNIAAVDFTDPSLKVGKDCATYIFGIFGPIGTNRIDQAARKGDVKKIGFVEYEYDFYLFASKACTVVHGH